SKCTGLEVLARREQLDRPAPQAARLTWRETLRPHHLLDERRREEIAAVVEDEKPLPLQQSQSLVQHRARDTGEATHELEIEGGSADAGGPQNCSALAIQLGETPHYRAPNQVRDHHWERAFERGVRGRPRQRLRSKQREVLKPTEECDCKKRIAAGLE